MVALNKIGGIIKEHLGFIKKIKSGVKVDEFVVMPNHVHMILIFENEETPHWVETPPKCVKTPQWGVFTSAKWKPNNLGVVINHFKMSCTKKIWKITKSFQWQSNYYEKVIWNELMYNAVKIYINENPKNWSRDRNNPFDM